jgi:TonB-linked SusC/RagA family outer membrane protein
MRKILALMLGVIVFYTALHAQQTRAIAGRVTDENGQPVVGASIIVQGTNIGTTSDANGYFTINVAPTARILLISAVGYGQQEITIGTQSTVNATLSIASGSMEEVVVTGYTTRRRSQFTGAASKVTAEKIAQVPLGSFEQILQGRAPGLYISSSSGQPGNSNSRVNIRGVGSISGSNSPLYVMDGIPIEANVFRSMNPNDFESVDVLKDAAGAGLYGAAAANGVIVITTKKGRAGRLNLQYRGQVGFSQPPTLKNLRLMNTEERLQYEENILGGTAGILGTGLTGYPGWDYSPRNPRYQNLTPTQRATEAALLDSIRSINTDWASLFFRNGKFDQHELSASGGAGNLTFYSSLSKYKQEGVIIRSLLDRYTYRGNVDFKTNRLTIGLRSSAGFSQYSQIESESAVALANPVAAAYLELPYRKPFRQDGKPNVGTGQTGANAYDRLFTTTDNINQFKGNLGIQAQFEIWNGISLRNTSSVDWRNNNSTRFIDPASWAGGLVATGAQGLYNEGNSENLILFTRTGLGYDKLIADKHNISASAFVEAIRERNRSIAATGYGINPQLPNTPRGITSGNATFLPAIGGGRSLSGRFSTLALVEYTYDNKYTFFGNIRNDAPSQVPLKNRDNIFWGVGGSWNIIREDFMEAQNIFQDLRLRASHGEVANVAGFASDFGYISTYSSLASGYAGVPAIVPSSPGNEEYSLESQVISNLGLDLSVWDRRLRITTEVYKKFSKNLFVSQGLSRTTGFNALSVNAGEVQNTGFEFDVNTDVIRGRELLLTIGVNGGFNKNEVTSLGLLSDIPAGTGIFRVGYPIGTHYTVGWLGVDPQSGLPIYEDIDGNPTTVYNAANNRSAYGTYLPSFVGGATLDLTWKGFFASALFHTAQGIQRFNNESFFYETTNSNVQFNKRVDMLNSWTKPGDITDYQRINSQRQFSSKDIEDASFVRFRNLQVGYTFRPPSTKIVNNVRLWGQAQNIYTWTKWQGFDPEESNNIANYEFPNPRTYTLGLDINF